MSSEVRATGRGALTLDLRVGNHVFLGKVKVQEVSESARSEENKKKGKGTTALQTK